MGIQSCLFLVAVATGVMADTEMGPAAFMWPPDRVWNPDTDNIGPCGSPSGPVNRTDFPLTSGSVALVAQDDSYSTRLSISYSADPKTQSEFITIIEPERMRELDPGHTCLKLPDARAGTRVGDKATFQIIYIADFDQPYNQTFYACTDITFVADKPAAMFGTCFNATTDVDVPAPTKSGVASVNPGHSDIPLPGTGTGASTDPPPGPTRLSGGAIAGIVIGALVGVALIVGGAIFLYRERKQKNRLIRQRDSARIGTFGPDPDNKMPKDSTSQHSIRLQDLGRPNA